jgi:multidrug resistance efflux pump
VDSSLEVFPIPTSGSAQFVERATLILLCTFVLSAAVLAPLAIWGSIEPTVTFEGSLQPGDEQPVYAQAAGLVHDVFVNSNDSVAAGQPIMRILSPEESMEKLRMRSQLAELESGERSRSLRYMADSIVRHAEEQAAIARVEQAEAALRQRLVDFGYADSIATFRSSYQRGRHVELDRAVASLVAVEADLAISQGRREALSAERLMLEGDRIQLAILREQIKEMGQSSERKTVRSPIGGVVATPHLYRLRGTAVSPGQRVASIADESSWTVSALVDDRTVAQLRVGMSARIEIVALKADGKEPIDGEVVSVGRRSVTEHEAGARGRYEVTLRLPQLVPDSVVRAGLLVNVNVVTERTTLVRHLWRKLLAPRRGGI